MTISLPNVTDACCVRSIAPSLNPESRSLTPDRLMDVASARLRNASGSRGGEGPRNTAIASADEEYTCLMRKLSRPRMTLAGFPCNSIGNEGVAPAPPPKIPNSSDGVKAAPKCTAITSADEEG